MKKLCLVLTLIFSPLSYSDVMNLNEFVPTHLEDATPVDEKTWIFQTSGKFEKENPDEINLRQDIRYGLTKRFQLEALIDNMTGGNEHQSGDMKATMLYVFNESDNALPIVAINPILRIPTGKNSDGIDAGAKIILTSTLKGSMDKPETQLHLNYQLMHNASRESGERADEGLIAFGLSRRLKENLALIVDVIHQDETRKESNKDYFEAGFHQQLGKQFYIGYGAGAGFGPSSPSWTGMLSLELEI